VFTVSTAITRLTSGPTNIFGDNGINSSQQLQRINEVLEYFYDQGTWRGVQATITITTSSGVMTLPAAYQRLDGLALPLYAQQVPIKSQQWAFQNGSIPVQDWTQYGNLVAIDMGDNGSGQRQYQLTGNTTNLDALSFTGLARKRFNWITDTSTVVVPDSYQSLVKGILAFRAMDNQDKDSFERLMGEAMSCLNGNLGEFEVEQKSLQVECSTGFGFSPYVM